MSEESSQNLIEALDVDTGWRERQRKEECIKPTAGTQLAKARLKNSTEWMTQFPQQQQNNKKNRERNQKREREDFYALKET